MNEQSHDEIMTLKKAFSPSLEDLDTLLENCLITLTSIDNKRELDLCLSAIRHVWEFRLAEREAKEND